MKTICGIDCSECGMVNQCRGCAETAGNPFGGGCVAAECIRAGGREAFYAFKGRVIDEANALGIPDMPPVKELFLLHGAYVNLEYSLPSGQKVKFLDDRKIYLGCQMEKDRGERCYGLVADERHLLVCEYGCGGDSPEIVVYKRRPE